METDDLLDAVRRYAMERYPQASSVRLSIIVPHGEGAEFSVPVYSGRPLAPAGRPAAREPAEKVYPNEMRVLNAVAGIGKENPTAAEIAESAGMKEYAGFNKLLLAMRRNGRLGGKAGTDAYPLTPKGQAAIDY